jgi:ribulose-5-phosphate 4-epimerase/fuculose-1-phosphate aldolase
MAKGKPTDITEAEWETRVDLAAAYRLVDLYGWSDLYSTHLSARVPGTDDQFLINPFGMLFEEMTASCLIKVDSEGNILSESEYEINPAGFTFHSAVHMSRDDALWAIHTHTYAGCAVSSQKDGMLPMNQHTLAVLDQVAYHDYEGIAMDLSERERIARDLGDKNILILRNHGLLTVGRTAGEVFMWMYRAERACRMQIAFQQTGAELIPIPKDVMDESMERNRFNNSEKGYRTIGLHEWPGLRRKLDRIDPSYKT